MTTTLTVQPGREASLRRHHPWIFSGAVGEVRGDPGPGDTVRVEAANGQFLAWAAFNPISQIRAKVWSFDQSDVVDAAFIQRRIGDAIGRRSWLDHTDAARWVFAESDMIPGLIVDRYGAVAVAEITGTASERWRPEIVAALRAHNDIDTVIERLDAPVRTKEGLDRAEPRVHGHQSDSVVISESHGATAFRFSVDVCRGHKTGTYLDQRDNRGFVAGLANGRSVLDVCCFGGGFTVAALKGGAREVVGIDSSAAALRGAHANLELNDLDSSATRFVKADAFEELRRGGQAGDRYGLIVLDPPKLAAGERDLKRAARAYKDLNLSALRMIEPGGWLVTFSCSGAVSEELFQKIVSSAALDAGRDVHIVRRLAQAGDHPVPLTFPEAGYLKGFVCQVN